MTAGKANSRSKISVKVVVILIGVVGIASSFLWIGEGVSLDTLVQHESGLRVFQQVQPLVTYGIAFLLYVTLTGISLPGASVLTLVSGWLFGFIPGLLLVSFASTGGASLAFLLSRYVFGDVIQSRCDDRLQVFHAALERDGPFYLFTLRLMPAVPYVGVNLVMGLTPIGLGTFWWVSQLGMLPATAVYVFVGATAPDLRTVSDNGMTGIWSPELLGALALLGLLPLLVRLGFRRLRASRL